jgi:hypothetical protein
MIGYTLPEIRRLLTGLVQRYLPDPAHMLAWSNWRRKRQLPGQGQPLPLCTPSPWSPGQWRACRARTPRSAVSAGTSVNKTVSQVLSRISSVEL